jgi:hypothetical protein
VVRGSDDDKALNKGVLRYATYRPAPYFDRVYPRPGRTSWPAITERLFDEREDAGGIGIAF